MWTCFTPIVSNSNKQEIDPESYKNLFGDSGCEDFYGFNDKH